MRLGFLLVLTVVVEGVITLVGDFIDLRVAGLLNYGVRQGTIGDPFWQIELRDLKNDELSSCKGSGWPSLLLSRNF